MSYSIRTSLDSLQANLIVQFMEDLYNALLSTLYISNLSGIDSLLIMAIKAFLRALSIHNRIKENNTPIHKRAGDLNK